MTPGPGGAPKRRLKHRTGVGVLLKRATSAERSDHNGDHGHHSLNRLPRIGEPHGQVFDSLDCQMSSLHHLLHFGVRKSKKIVSKNASANAIFTVSNFDFCKTKVKALLLRLDRRYRLHAGGRPGKFARSTGIREGLMPRSTALDVRFGGRRQDSSLQEPALQNWASGQAPTVTWYFDTFTGSATERPAFDSLMADIPCAFGVSDRGRLGVAVHCGES